MTSVSDFKDCPQCGGMAMYELQTRGLEEHMHCPECGYYSEVVTLMDLKKSREVSAEVGRLLNSGRVDDAMKLAGEDYEWTKTWGQRQKEAYLRGKLPLKFWKVSKAGRYVQRMRVKPGYGSYSIDLGGGGVRVCSLPKNKRARDRTIRELTRVREDGAKVGLSVFENGELKRIFTLQDG